MTVDDEAAKKGKHAAIIASKIVGAASTTVGAAIDLSEFDEVLFEDLPPASDWISDDKSDGSTSVDTDAVSVVTTSSSSTTPPDPSPHPVGRPPRKAPPKRTGIVTGAGRKAENVPADRFALKLANSIRKGNKSSKFAMSLPLKEIFSSREQGDTSVGIAVYGLNCGVLRVDKSAVEKVVLVVGQTGSGKSTHIDGIVNHYLGVTWDDDFRFKLIREDLFIDPNAAGNQAMSQTNWITAYKIPKFTGSRYPYSLTIIDTPGFGDSRGLKQDERTVQAMKRLFECALPGAPPSQLPRTLDSIAFVTTSASVRLTPSQKFVYNAVLDMFHHKVKDNFSVHFTFADAKCPPALQAVKEANVPFSSWHKFNNSALFINPTGEGDDGDEGDELSKIYFQMGQKQLEKYCKDLTNMVAQSMADQADVLDERQSLDGCLVQLGPLVQNSLDALNQMSQFAMLIASKSAEIDCNANFEVRQNETYWVEEHVKPGQHTTRCFTCNQTCHEICYIAGDDKNRCCMIRNGFCISGQCRCPVSAHKDFDHIRVRKDKWVTVTMDDKKKAFEAATGEKATSENMINKLIEDYNATQKAIMQNIGTMRLSKIRLSEIALRPSSLTEIDHLDILIRGEQSDAKPGWEERCNQLREVKRKVQIGADVASGQSPMEKVLARYLKNKDANMQAYLSKLQKIHVKSDAELLEERGPKKHALPPMPFVPTQQCKRCAGTGCILYGLRACPDCQGRGTVSKS